MEPGKWLGENNTYLFLLREHEKIIKKFITDGGFEKLMRLKYTAPPNIKTDKKKGG